MMLRSCRALVWALLAGCASAPQSPGAGRRAASQPSPARPAQSSTAASAEPEHDASAGSPCGEQGCLAFATPEAAFEYVLGAHPRVLAVGEAHAPRGQAGIHSSTRRFAERFLPLLAGKSKHIVIELLLANCAQQTQSAVERAQKPVTEAQAEGNQNEFLALGRAARRLGIEPQALTPSCADYDTAVAAGDEAVPRLLRLIAEQTTKSVESLLNAPAPSKELVLIYGGALHNDLYPRPGQESWSFGPTLSSATQGRYVELDLIVPEFVEDREPWRNLPWFKAFDRARLRSETLLFRPAPNSFALIFPKTEPPAQEGR